MRLILLALLWAPVLCAQTSLPLSGTAPDTRIRTFLFELDLGAGAQPYTVTANLNTSAPSGLTVRLIDLRGYAADATPSSSFVNQQVVAGAGTANCALSGNASGLRCFAVEVRPTGSGTSDFSGSFNATAGAATLTAQDQVVVGSTTLQLQVGKLATWSRAVGGGQTPQGLELNFGAVSQTVAVRFEAQGAGLSKIDVYDNTGGSATLLTTFSASGGTINQTTVLLLTHSGVATLRVNTHSPSGGNVTWRLSVPCSVTLGVPGSNDSKVDESDSCTASSRPGPWLVLAVLPALLAALRRRRA